MNHKENMEMIRGYRSVLASCGEYSTAWCMDYLFKTIDKLLKYDLAHYDLDTINNTVGTNTQNFQLERNA